MDFPGFSSGVDKAKEFLDVSFNQIRDDGAMAFAIALPDNQSLRTLNLAETWFFLGGCCIFPMGESM